MIKMVTVTGARPQFIKSAAVSRAIAEYNKKNSKKCDVIAEKIIHTGQHYDYLMDGVFFDELRLKKPDYNLRIGSHAHGKQTGLMLEGIERILTEESPDCVLVYGDTNSTLAGALAAKKMNIPVAHVEAGLRSYDMSMPEEINRVLVDKISDILFCPSERAIKNLLSEGITHKYPKKFPGVFLVGDVMYDALLFYLHIAKKKSGILKKESLKRQEYYLLTTHRAENTDNKGRLKEILTTLNEIAREGTPVIFPAHPRTAKLIPALNIKAVSKALKILPPVAYFDMLTLEANAKAIITDSGGIQKEAYFLKVPCITLRETTEWIETVEAGYNCIVGTDGNKIKKAVRGIGKTTYTRDNCYGNGTAGLKIAGILRRVFFKK